MRSLHTLIAVQFLKVLSEGMDILERRHNAHELPTLASHIPRPNQLTGYRVRIGHLYEAKRMRSAELEAVDRAEKERQRAEQASNDFIKRTVSAPGKRRKARTDGLPSLSALGARKRSGSGRTVADGLAVENAGHSNRARAGSFSGEAGRSHAPAKASASPALGPASSPELGSSPGGIDEGGEIDAVALERQVHANMERQLAHLSGLLKKKASKVLDDLKADNKVCKRGCAGCAKAVVLVVVSTR